jgi:hypothetical protein
VEGIELAEQYVNPIQKVQKRHGAYLAAGRKGSMAQAKKEKTQRHWAAQGKNK